MFIIQQKQATLYATSLVQLKFAMIVVSPLWEENWSFVWVPLAAYVYIPPNTARTFRLKNYKSQNRYI